MPHIRDDVEPGTYAGLIIVNHSTGHAEFREITALLTELDDQGNGVSQTWMVKGRDGLGEARVTILFPEELWSSFLAFPDRAIPTVGYLSLGTPIRYGTTAWDHLDADLEQIRTELGAVS